MVSKGKTVTDKSKIATGGGKQKSRRTRFFLAALAVTVLVVGIVAFVWGSACFLFTHNRHLELKHVKVYSSGWWDGKETMVRKVLGVSNGTNMFKLDLRKLREKMESHPSIRKASVARILPDTLALKLIERIPRAFLNNSKSPWVVDETGMVMDRSTCIALDENLPVILGLDKNIKLKAGTSLPEVSPALEMIMLTITRYRNFRVAAISVSNPRELRSILYFRDQERPYKAYMPSKELPKVLEKLNDCINKANRMGDPRHLINLNYKGQAVLR